MTVSKTSAARMAFAIAIALPLISASASYAGDSAKPGAESATPAAHKAPIVAANAVVGNSITLRDTWSGNGWANIGSLDTGIWIDHFKLRDAPRLHLSANFVPNCGPNNEVAETACLDPDTGAAQNPARGHGTMTAGVMVADDTGDALTGACMGCSLSLSRVNIKYPVNTAMSWLVRNGVQVVNASWGGLRDPYSNCLANPTYDEKCPALSLYEKRDVAFVAANGNMIPSAIYSSNLPNFPASDPRSFAVGGVVSTTDQSIFNSPVSSPYGWVPWREAELKPEVWDTSEGCPSLYAVPPAHPECGTQASRPGFSSGTPFSAPSRDVLTTFIPYFDYQAIAPSQGTTSYCGDQRYSVVGEDTCRGTSFSAPRVSGLIARTRSYNPVLPLSEIRAVLINASPLKEVIDNGDSSTLSNGVGYGLPNVDNTGRVGTPWQIVFGTKSRVNGLWYNYSAGYYRGVNNRLTPMFGLTRTSGTRQDWLYTAVPQVATAAVLGELHTRPNEALTTPYVSNAASASISQYGRFPMEIAPTAAMTPRASFFVYTSTGGTNPPGDYFPESFSPLFRLSAERRCSSGLLPHIYATTVAERNQLVTSGLPSALVCPEEAASTIKFNWDAVEGYVMKTCPTRFGGCLDSAPASTPKCVYRRYNAGKGTWGLFIGNQRNDPQYAGFNTTYGAECLGYAAENVDSDNDGVIDASEAIIGTNPSRSDSDNDGWSDGAEYNLTRVSKCDPTVNDWSCYPY